MKKTKKKVRASAYEVMTDEELVTCARIDVLDLSRELVRQSAYYAWIMTRSNQAAARVLEVADRLEWQEAEAWKRAAVEYPQYNAQLKAAKMDEDYLDAKEVLRTAKERDGFYKGAERVFAKRHELLLALNANERKEREDS